MSTDYPYVQQKKINTEITKLSSFCLKTMTTASSRVHGYGLVFLLDPNASCLASTATLFSLIEDLLIDTHISRRIKQRLQVTASPESSIDGSLPIMETPNYLSCMPLCSVFRHQEVHLRISGFRNLERLDKIRPSLGII